MKYRVITETKESAEREFEAEVPALFGTEEGESVIDKLVYALAKNDQLELADKPGVILDMTTKVTEVWRGDLRIYPRVRTIKPKTKSSKKSKAEDDTNG